MKVRLIGTHSQEWRSKFREVLQKKIQCTFVEDFWEFGSGPAVVAHDSILIKDADVIIANCNKKVGPGTAMELVISKYFSKFVICVLSKKSELRKTKQIGKEIIEDWIHPFIETFSDIIIEKIEDIPSSLETTHSKKIDEIDKLMQLAEEKKDFNGINKKDALFFK